MNMMSRSVVASAIALIDFDKVERNPFRDLENNPLQAEQVANLTNAIKSTTFWQHLPVRPHPELADHYQLAFGHGRLEAAKLAGLRSAHFVVESYDDETMLRMQTDENVTQFGKDRFATYKEATVNAAEWIMADVLALGQKFLPLDSANASQVKAAIFAGGCPGEDTIARFYTPKGPDGDVLMVNGKPAESTLNLGGIRAALKVYTDTGELAAWHRKHNPKATKELPAPTLDPEALRVFTKTDHVRTFVKAVQETHTPVAEQLAVAEKIVAELAPPPKRSRTGRENFQAETPTDERFNSKNIRTKVVEAAQDRTRSPKRKAELERLAQMTTLEHALAEFDTGLTRTVNGCRQIIKIIDAVGAFQETDMTVTARHHLAHAVKTLAELQKYLGGRVFKKTLRIG